MRLHLIVMSFWPSLRPRVCATRTCRTPHRPDSRTRTLPAIEASTVDVPVSVSLAFLRNQVESRGAAVAVGCPVQRTDQRRRRQLRRRAASASDGVIDRSPINMAANGNTLGMSFGVQYWVEARARGASSVFAVRCVEGAAETVKPRRTANLSIAVPISVASNWALVANNASVAATATNRCDVTIFERDVTDKVMAAFHRRLQEPGERTQREIAAGRLAFAARVRLAVTSATGQCRARRRG